MPALEIVSLSMNKINSLEIFACLPRLRELYLRKNAISDIREVNFLKACSNLEVLWLRENPIEHH